jgi:hypothetical protein
MCRGVLIKKRMKKYETNRESCMLKAKNEIRRKREREREREKERERETNLRLIRLSSCIHMRVFASWEK